MRVFKIKYSDSQNKNTSKYNIKHIYNRRSSRNIFHDKFFARKGKVETGISNIFILKQYYFFEREHIEKHENNTNSQRETDFQRARQIGHENPIHCLFSPADFCPTPLENSPHTTGLSTKIRVFSSVIQEDKVWPSRPKVDVTR